jgi:hypothetical protein
VDEVLAQARRLAERAGGRIETLGSYRDGSPLELVRAGTGRRQVLLLGGPHPNEPVGMLSCLELLRLLGGPGPQAARLRAGWTWNVVACWDAVGARRNEGWYGVRPLTPEIYHRWFYRPRLCEQPEWTFPLPGPRPAGPRGRPQADGLWPETRAVMDAVDRLRPELVASLHNTDMDGAFFMISRQQGTLAAELSRLPARFGLSLGRYDADSVGWDSPAPGVHVLPGAEELYILGPQANAASGTRGSRGSCLDGGACADGARTDGRGHGACSLHYAERVCGALGVIAEVPLWRMLREPAPGPARWPQRMAELADLADRRAAEPIAPYGLDAADADGYADDPVYLPPVRETLRLLGNETGRWRTMPRPDDPELAADVWNSVRAGAYRLPLRALGMRLRSPLPAAPGLRALLPALSAEFAAELGVTPTPIRDLIRAQLAAVLVTLEHSGWGQE